VVLKNQGLNEVDTLKTQNKRADWEEQSHTVQRHHNLSGTLVRGVNSVSNRSGAKQVPSSWDK